MSAEGNTNLYEGIPTIQDAFIVIVKTEWNALHVNELENGVVRILKNQGIEYKTLTVPGAVEISFAVKLYANSNQKKADAFITLGTIIRGDTPHFDYVCRMVTDGISALNLTLESPVIFGVLTVNNEQQGIERLGGAHGHKGEEAAITALKMIALKRSFVN